MKVFVLQAGGVQQHASKPRTGQERSASEHVPGGAGSRACKEERSAEAGSVMIGKQSLQTTLFIQLEPCRSARWGQWLLYTERT